MSEAKEAPTTYELIQPGRLLDVLEICMADRIRPDRSGWSAATHLGRDLERFFGVRAPAPAIDRALRVLKKRKRIHLKVDDEGVIWFKLLQGD